MRLPSLFSKMLRLERPWGVNCVRVDSVHQEIVVNLDYRRGASFRCPVCDARLPIYDHSNVRRWRHLDFGGWKTWIEARVPRVHCVMHRVRRVRVPWALANSHFSAAFENHAIDVLLEADVLGAARLLRLSWDEAWGVAERAVSRGLKRKRRRIIRRFGVDEKAIAKRHRYVTLVTDLDRGTVEFVAFDRKTSSLDEYLESLTDRQRNGIEAVAIDMWEPYILSLQNHLKDAAAKIVFDRFHIMKHMTEAVDKVRKQEHRRLQVEGDETLKKTKYLWLHSEENLSEPDAARFAELKDLNLKTARAWAIKESFRVLWTYSTRGWGERYWTMWHSWASRSRMQPIVSAARMVKSHLEGVLNYFNHRITNAVSEGLNSKIQALKKTRMAIAIGSI